MGCVNSATNGKQVHLEQQVPAGRLVQVVGRGEAAVEDAEQTKLRARG